MYLDKHFILDTSYQFRWYENMKWTMKSILGICKHSLEKLNHWDAIK